MTTAAETVLDRMRGRVHTGHRLPPPLYVREIVQGCVPALNTSEVLDALCELEELGLVGPATWQLTEGFPESRALSIDWGEPFCFRCGWLAPTRETADYPEAWKWERVFKLTWDGAGGWLERAHLHDHQHGGPSKPLDLVPLCPLCHEHQPTCRTRAEGIAFVNRESHLAHLVPYAQMYTDSRYRNRSRPGKSEAHRCLLRAYAEAGAAFAKEYPAHDIAGRA